MLDNILYDNGLIHEMFLQSRASLDTSSLTNSGVFPFSHGFCLCLAFLDVCVLCGHAFFLDESLI